MTRKTRNMTPAALARIARKNAAKDVAAARAKIEQRKAKAAARAAKAN